MACVRIDRYTPVTRLRNASQPKTNANSPGTSTTKASCSTKLSAKAQISGKSLLPTTPNIWLPMPAVISSGVGGRTPSDSELTTIRRVRSYISHMPII